MPLRAFFVKHVHSAKEKFSVVVWPVIVILVEEVEALVVSTAVANGSEVSTSVTSFTQAAKSPSDVVTVTHELQLSARFLLNIVIRPSALSRLK